MQTSPMEYHTESNSTLPYEVPEFNYWGFDSQQGLQISRLHSMSETENDDQLFDIIDWGAPNFGEHLLPMEIQEPELLPGRQQAFQTPADSDPSNELKMKQESQEDEDQEQKGFFKGHIAHLSKRRVNIFPLNRKIHKTKKTNKNNKPYYSYLDKYMPGKVKGSSKRFDQKQQSHYEKLSAQAQKDHDQTYAAIRSIEASSDEESKKFLKTYKLKYIQGRKWAVFLDIFVNMA